MSLAAVALLALGCAAAGSRLRGRLAGEGQEPGYRACLQLAAGLVGLHLGLVALDAVGVPWTALALPLLLAGLAVVFHLLSRRRPAAPPALPWRPGWGDGVAAAAAAALAVFAARLWIVYPDFVFHWGIKGHKFFLAGGLDFAYLARPWNWFIHPAYPHLPPVLFAATGLAAGEFDEAAMMLWTPVFFAALLLAARQALRQSGVSPFGLQAGVAALGLGGATFGIGYSMAGSPDWLLALAPLLAAPALLGARGPAADLAVGLAAALAAGAKVEGLPMAALLVGVHLAGRGPGRLRALPRTLGPAALVVLPWLLQGLRHGLFGELAGGSFSLRHAGVVLGAMGESLLARAWHGAGWILLLLPLLWLPRTVRPLAAVCSLQLAFYLWIYLTLPYDGAEAVHRFVRSNFARLAFHLVPTLLVATVIAADRWATRRAPLP